MNTLVKAEIWTVAHTDEGNAVLVRPIGTDIAVPIFIGQLETQSILIGFGAVAMPRPLTHDLLIEILKRLNAELLRVEINDLRDSTFFARLVIGQGETELMIDARPSDALALAVRQKCPVYIAESVVESAGVSVNLIMDVSAPSGGTGSEQLEVPTDRKPDKAGDRRSVLMDELESAVAAEDYERAAVIRDILKEEPNEKPGS